MRIKKYLVNSLPDAMQQIKSDLGHEAVILNTKKVKTGGFLGLFKKQQIEVIAAIDPEKKEKQEKAKKQEKQAPNQAVSVVPRTNVEDEEVISEIKSIKKYLLHLITEKEQHLSPALEKVNQRLKKHDISKEICSEIIAKLMLKLETENDYGEKEIYSWTKEEIIRFIKLGHAKQHNTFSKVTCFIGPTGVGKTTTIAKLAADLMLKEKKKIGFITTDTYRIAAVEQLKTYAGILNIPIEVVYSPDELKNALDRLDSCDYILMDTAGRNYFEKEYVDELALLLGNDEEVQTNIVISLTSKYSDLKEIIDSFAELTIHSILFTKLDETRSYGIILNLLHEYRLPFTYLTNGQNVPDDIILASPEIIADLILGEDAHG